MCKDTDSPNLPGDREQSHHDATPRVARIRLGVRWSQAPPIIAARLDQLTGAELLRVTVMNRDKVVGSTDLTRAGGSTGPDEASPASAESLSSQSAQAFIDRQNDRIVAQLETLRLAAGLALADDGETGVQFRAQHAVTDASGEPQLDDAATEADREAAHAMAFRLDRSALGALIRFDHPVPLSRGMTERYVTEHFPGWNWPQMDRLLTTSDTRFITPARPTDRGMAMPTVRANVHMLHFSADDDWVVEWMDGAVTRSPRRVIDHEPRLC
ncbi:hypothetical protein [Pseudoclavibacter sp. CFCC 13611]|uniref:hypothetical protein n=1 Tax=Pseudoclavibacter sp. CFCC 13611 TaxID=2615178 RepID=UPI0013012B12|nr:hypothetical protein [Pseudoclavibacter sp. CFCC 13611]KAB1663230.1 hypothetical protein F8O08_05520 [Pseudoclavibacter sp. CFCC 13611]